MTFNCDCYFVNCHVIIAYNNQIKDILRLTLYKTFNMDHIPRH